MGPIEELVLRAWGHGVRIDAGDAARPDAHAETLMSLLVEARRVDRRANQRRTT